MAPVRPSDEQHRDAATLAAVLGAVGAFLVIAIVVDDVGFAAARASPRFWIGAGLLVAAGTLVPYWAVRAFDRWRD